VLLSLLAACAFGAGDFLGGLSTRRAPALATTIVAQAAGLALLFLWVPWTMEQAPDARTLAWGAFSGVTGTVAALTLYPALALGSASEVAPLSAVIGTALPVLFGVLLGERPSASAWAGIALAVCTIVLVSSDGRASALAPEPRRRALGLAAISGTFIGAFLIGFERAGTGQGLVPLLVARGLSLPLLVLAALVARRPLWPRGVSRRPALASGVFDISANGLYLTALASAPLSIAATLSNLYPAWTVLLGIVFLRDRPRPVQQLGLALALGAIVLITR
jgi:uncharacterized membrane protein